MKKTTSLLSDPALAAAYERLGSLLDDPRVLECPFASFSLLCRGAGARPRRMDALVRSELGVGGRELVRSLRLLHFSKISKSDAGILAIKR